MTFHDHFQDFFDTLHDLRSRSCFQNNVKTITHSRYFLLCCSKENNFESFCMTFHDPFSNSMTFQIFHDRYKPCCYILPYLHVQCMYTLLHVYTIFHLIKLLGLLQCTLKCIIILHAQVAHQVVLFKVVTHLSPFPLVWLDGVCEVLFLSSARFSP